MTGTQFYLERDQITDRLVYDMPAGVRARVVSVMEIAGQTVSVFSRQDQDKHIVDIISKYGGQYGLGEQIINIREVENSVASKVIRGTPKDGNSNESE